MSHHHHPFHPPSKYSTCHPLTYIPSLCQSFYPTGPPHHHFHLITSAHHTFHASSTHHHSPRLSGREAGTWRLQWATVISDVLIIVWPRKAAGVNHSGSLGGVLSWNSAWALHRKSCWVIIVITVIFLYYHQYCIISNYKRPSTCVFDWGSGKPHKWKLHKQYHNNMVKGREEGSRMIGIMWFSLVPGRNTCDAILQFATREILG